MTEIVEDTPTTGQKFAAEVLGTFVLVFFGVGAAVMSGGDYVATGLSFGLTVVVMAYAVGRVSGGHFNPAVTVGAALGGRLPWSATPIYVGAQLLGALLAGAVLFGLLHGFAGYTAEGNIGANSFGDQGSGYAMWAAFLLEMLMTAVFIWVILGVTDARNEFQAFMGPLAIGLALAMIHFASMGATGTSVNPARSIGVGVFGGTDAILQLWLFILAPLVGGAIAGLTYPLIFGHGAEPVPGSGLSLRRRPQAAGGVRPAERLRAAVEPGPAAAVAARLPRPSRGGQDPYAAPAQGQPGQPGPPPPQQWGPPAPSSSSPASGASRRPAAASPPRRSRPAPQQWGQPHPGRRRGRPHPGAPTGLTSAAGEVHQLDDLVAGRGLLEHQTDAPARRTCARATSGSSGVVSSVCSSASQEPYGVVRARVDRQHPALVLGDARRRTPAGSRRRPAASPASPARPAPRRHRPPTSPPWTARPRRRTWCPRRGTRRCRRVLGEPVVGVLDEPAVGIGDDVVHDGGRRPRRPRGRRR